MDTPESRALTHSRIGAVLALALVVVACADSVATVRPSRPATPEGWTTVEVGSGDLRMDLPPWLVPFDTVGALFANEPPEPGVTGFLQLLAEGPRTAMPQPTPREPLERWLEARIESAGRGPGTARRIDLPAGAGVVIERVVRADSPEPLRLAAYAIETPFGVAYLLIDGPAPSWTGHEADAAVIPMLMQLGPG